MLQIIVKAVFWILNTLANIFMTPLLVIFQMLSLTWIPHVLEKIVVALGVFNKYFMFLCDILCVPHILLSAVLGLASAFFLWNVSVKTIALATAIYRAFKP